MAYVFMDNLPAYKRPGVHKAIENAGASLFYLLPYSPDLNPIEMAFAKLKVIFRAAAPRNIGDLWQAIADALSRLATPEYQSFRTDSTTAPAEHQLEA